MAFLKNFIQGKANWESGGIETYTSQHPSQMAQPAQLSEFMCFI
jgi:hypothetical protein